MLATTTYSAFRGYSWSHMPPGTDEAELDLLRRLASEERGDFPDPTDISRGLVSDGRIAAVYSIRTVAGWDSEGRASEYAALALMPVEDDEEADDENGYVVFMKIEQDENGEDMYVSVDDDKLVDVLFEKLTAMLDEEE